MDPGIFCLFLCLPPSLNLLTSNDIFSSEIRDNNFFPSASSDVISLRRDEDNQQGKHLSYFAKYHLPGFKELLCPSRLVFVCETVFIPKQSESRCLLVYVMNLSGNPGEG